MDAVLSSGFLAFARHAGFFAGLEDLGVELDAVVGTSSGALLGAFWATGMPADEALARVTEHRPIAWLRPHLSMWKGALTLDRFVEGMREYLPDTFEELERPFAVGVAAGRGKLHRLITSGPLPEAVVASCAVPYLFKPVSIAGDSWVDGAKVDRVALDAWRSWRPGREAIVHLVDRTRGALVVPDLQDMPVVRSRPSKAGFWNLGDVQGRFEAARQGTLAALRERFDQLSGDDR